MGQKTRIIYIDMDDTLCDYSSAYRQSKMDHPEKEYPQSQIGFFEGLEPIEGAVEAFQMLSSHPEYEVYILSAPSEYNSNSYTEKRLWVEKHLGFETVSRLIIASNKGLLKGEYLIDDYIEGKGQEFFEGCLLHFGSDEYPDWSVVMDFFSGLNEVKSDKVLK